MTLTDDFTLKCMKGSPVFLDDICAIYPRKLGDIVDIGYSTFLKYINLFNMEKPSSQEVKDNELGALLNKLDDFQYFLFMVNIDSESNQLAKNAFHFFTHEQVIFSLEQEEIIVKNISQHKGSLKIRLPKIILSSQMLRDSEDK